MSGSARKSSTAMEREALQESAGHLILRMKELGDSIHVAKTRCCQALLLYGYCMGHMLSISSQSSTTCDLVRMLLSLSLVIFSITGFFLYGKLRGLKNYSAEVERVRAELRENRHRLLKLGADHETYWAELAPDGTSQWAYRVVSAFVTSSFLVMSGIYTFGCHR